MSKELSAARITNYTPSHRETSSIGKRKLLTPDEVLRLPRDDALVILRGQKVLRVKKFDYTKHPEAKKLRNCNAMDYIPNWRAVSDNDLGAEMKRVVEKTVISSIKSTQRLNEVASSEPIQAESALSVKAQQRNSYDDITIKSYATTQKDKITSTDILMQVELPQTELPQTEDIQPYEVIDIEDLLSD